ncbi:nitrogen fixation protein NifM [Methylobacter sp. YRD-M1]|uniref:nitrogen fixation protein NifM n=1 Tax=Methylobacter sp. YRD-M1 TaxID=2911520 RepID=UPI00227B0926|nr:nitrogen fixation protein NifM [Methylobacter sp. YRD-M1]WAK01257.1 nitrogen fixation protein NifM [Methylobacter sp. YRD-M1]
METVERTARAEPYALLRSSLALFRKAPDKLDPVQLRQAETQARNEYRLESRVLNAPEAASVIIPERELQMAYQEVRDRYEDDNAFLTELAKNQLTEATLREALYRQCKVNAVLEKVAARSPEVNEVEIGIYYHLHAEQFNRPELREACHIFISINPDYPENTRENAWDRIQDIRARLLKKPYKFAELALKYSECPTSLNGGALGKVPRGKLYPELDAVLFSMKTGEISEVLESEIGFHVLLCKQIHRAETISLKNATPKIRQLMKERYRSNCQRAWLASLPVAETEGKSYGG